MVNNLVIVYTEPHLNKLQAELGQPVQISQKTDST